MEIEQKHCWNLKIGTNIYSNIFVSKSCYERGTRNGDFTQLSLHSLILFLSFALFRRNQKLNSIFIKLKIFLNKLTYFDLVFCFQSCAFNCV